MAEPSLSGRHRKIEPRASLPLRWPAGAKQRYDLFDGWHDIAMQIVHKAQGDFRLLAAAKKVLNWKRGDITLSNADLAQRAGRCSEKTISRGVKLYSDLGIFTVEMGWRKKRDGTFLRTRIIRPALPVELEPDIVLPPDISFDLDTRGPDHDVDTRGPDQSTPHLDTRGPEVRDTRGPITIVTIGAASASS